MKFRKKPVIIEAVQWNGENFNEIDSMFLFLDHTDRVVRRVPETKELRIDTLEGTMTASVRDWIIRGEKGELYPCKPDIFESTYDKVE